MRNIQFSFGQTSGFLLRRLMDEHGARFDKDFIVTFENTGKEHDKTLDFGHEVETRWGVRIVWLEYRRFPARNIPVELVPAGKKRKNLIKKQRAGGKDHWFRIVDYKTAKRSADPDTPFDTLLGWANVLPNVASRMCSVQMKLRTRDRYFRSIGINEFDSFIGIRADEAHRVEEIRANVDQYETPYFPLCASGVTKQDVDVWWNKQPFKLEIASHLGNCKGCYLKARWKRIKVAREDREAIEWHARWESRFEAKATTGARFRDGESYAGLLAESDNQTELDLSETDVPCSCSVGGYRRANRADD